MIDTTIWAAENTDEPGASLRVEEGVYILDAGGYQRLLTDDDVTGLYQQLTLHMEVRRLQEKARGSGLVLARTMPGNESKNGKQPVPANLPPGVTPDMMEFTEGEPVAFMTIVAGDRGCVQFVGRQKFLLSVQRMTVPYKAMVDYVTGYLNASVNAQPPLRP